MTLFASILLVRCAGTGVPAAASRYVAADAAAIPVAPVCFVPLTTGSGLAARANAQHLQEVCEAGARNQGVYVVPFESPSCLAAATMSWASRPTGEIVADCGPLGARCVGSEVHGKTLRMAVGRRSDGKPLSETISLLQSDFASITDHTVFALCNAAFYHYPIALRNEQFAAPVGD